MINLKLNKFLIIVIILTSMFLNGCTSSKEINTLGLTISIGIDKWEEGYLVTYQLLNPKAIASKKSSTDAPVYLYTETGKDLFETLRRITTTSPRKAYSSHLRMIVFGEEAAKDGLKGILDFLIRDHEFRTDYYFAVAKGTTANNILKVLTPLEQVSGLEMYYSIQSSEKAWAPTKSVKIIELVNNILSDGINPVLTGVEIIDENNQSDSVDALKHSNTAKLNLGNLCVFKDDKLAGWLTEDESKGYNYITGNVKNTIGYIEIDDQNKITFEVTNYKSKMKANIIDNKLTIIVDINIESNIAAETGDFDVTTEENIEKVNKMIGEKLSDICNSALVKSSEDLGSDIFGFGEVVHRTYPKLWAKIKNDWNSEFTKVPVKINVHSKIDALGESTKSIFSKGSK